MRNSNLSTHNLEDVCSVCGNEHGSKKYKSELVRGNVCKECKSVEQNSWKKYGIGAGIILIVWLAAKILNNQGIINSGVSNFFSLWWWLVWFGVCLWMAHRNLNKRRKGEVNSTRQP
jgi:hypothetical protein